MAGRVRDWYVAAGRDCLRLLRRLNSALSRDSIRAQALIVASMMADSTAFILLYLGLREPALALYALKLPLQALALATLIKVSRREARDRARLT